VLRCARPRVASNASVVTHFDFNRADAISSVLSDVLSDVRVDRGAATLPLPTAFQSVFADRSEGISLLLGFCCLSTGIEPGASRLRCKHLTAVK